MHDDMPYDPIQGQGHGASELPKIALFKLYLLNSTQLKFITTLWSVDQIAQLMIINHTVTVVAGK